ncbi:16S rRNA (adenine(1518)-N(6)/adenine(1519)-N(6))-dimethyltransferase RsmA [Candidatus Parcubacteria bacterium]|nr:ribosomal RNA small subunit methyltransferase A [Patescibacteria group bacterium]MCG2694093.1 16S rRNA (adenine(1518)-N(6)/adenine(1519)-N(6))-dimethyltransferase RsmA [Candidatus Parcubacteria bacterium]
MKDILRQYDIKPSKFRGQNFLVNKGIVEKIINSAELSKKDTVLEIGPGLGVLTEELIKKSGKVIAVEKDKKLFELLKEKFKDEKNLELINADILTYNLQPTSYKLIANIPYNITGRIFRKFLIPPTPPSERGGRGSESRPQLLIIMVQKEVGEKLLGKSRGMLTILAELYGKAEKVCNVSAGSFYPAPKIDSMVIKLTIGLPKPYSEEVLKIAKIGFSQRRKKLISNLSTGLKLDKKKLREVFLEVGIKENARAEELSKDDWLKLAEKFLKYT